MSNLEELEKSLSTLRLDKYELVKSEKLPDLNSAGIILKHKKSGARIVVVSNDDKNKVFSIGFKTPAFNDTGLQHILEHSTLCGSKKYPVKDPFVELCKGSLNTFLNAMTYPDKTIYPVASCNMADYKNITDVYMDAVFNPAIYERPQIFKQEGWHYELENKESELEINGVVYNEMKGVYSSADDVLSRYTFISLFPDSVYKNESGGEPSVIPELTYEEFLKYHSNYYHPVNSYIYMYGDIDVQERLDYLDEEYLCNYSAADADINVDIDIQKPFGERAALTKSYAVTDDEPVENNSYLSLNWVVGTSLDAKLSLAMQILEYVLITAPGAKVKKSLIDAGIADDIDSSLESSIYQPVFSIIAKSADENRKDEFEAIIRGELEDIVKNGIDMKMVDAGINTFEFKHREADFGPYPKGLMYYLTMMDSWLYDENEAFIHMHVNSLFDELKNDKDNRYFENIIQKYLLDNNHCSLVTLVPERGLEEKNDWLLKEKLADIKAAMSEAELEKLVEETKALKEYQDEPSPQEELEKIPMLTLEDLDKEPEPYNNNLKQVNGVTVVHHNMFTNRIAYLILSFNAKNVPEELMKYMGFLSMTLGDMDTQNYTYTELANEINTNCGGIGSDAVIYTDNQDNDKYIIAYEFKAKVLYEKTDFVFDMINEIAYTTKFNDYKRLKEIVARAKARMESVMMSAGHSIAMLSGVAGFSPTGYYSDMMRGYSFYQLVKNIYENFDEKKEELADKLHELVKLLFNKENLIISCNADDSGYEGFVKPCSSFVSNMSDNHYEEQIRGFVPTHVNKAYTSSSQVQYVARCGNFCKEGFEYTGALKVLKVIFSYEYLWLNVRVKGGAYGCMSGFGRNGDLYLLSYRDPNLKKTNEIFEGAADYVESFDVSDRDMLKYIIGTIGGIDTPRNPSAKGIRSFSAYMSNVDFEDIRKERLDIINCTQKDIRALADLIRKTINQNYLCVVGNQKLINDEAGLFNEIKSLLN